MTQIAARAPGIGGMLEGRYSPILFLQGMVTAWVLGLVGGLYPAWRGANLSPMEALRYEGGAGGGNLGSGWMARLMRHLPNSLRNLARRKGRTVLTALGIGVGVASLVALGALTDGLIQQLNQLAGSTGAGDITVMQADVPDMSLSTVDERIGQAIAAMPEVKSVSGMLMGFVMTEEMPLFIVMGLDPNAEAIHHYKLVEGQSIRRPSDIIIGRTAADNYKLRLGDSVQLYQNRYRIAGIYETGVAWEEGGGVIALREAQSMLNKPRQVGFFFVTVRQRQDAAYVQATIARRFQDVKASLSSEFAQNTQDIQNTRAMASAIIALTVFIGGIVITNTMVMAVMERTREIGTLRALGWEESRILSTIISESAVLGLVSAIAGIGLGVGMLQLMALIPSASSFVQGVYSPRLFLQATGLALFLGIIGGAYPAWRATQLSPIEALRYE
jgi:putative ABC transport system permease protein